MREGGGDGGHPNPGGVGRLEAREGVLEDYALVGGDAQERGGGEEEVGSGLAALHVLDAHHVVEGLVEAEPFERQVAVGPRRGGGERHGDAGLAQPGQEGHGPGHLGDLVPVDLAVAGLLLVGEAPHGLGA